MQWEHMRPTSQSLAAGELDKAGVLCGVESSAVCHEWTSPGWLTREVRAGHVEAAGKDVWAWNL